MIDYNLYKKTLKECSIDTSRHQKQHLVDNENKAFSLDDYFIVFFKNNKKDRIKSIDAIFSKYCDFDHKNMFIEFKNQKLDNIKFDELYSKIYNSIIVFFSENNYSIAKSRANNEFILVYKDDLEKITDYLYELANQKFKGVERFKNFLFSNVRKITSDEFDECMRDFINRT